MKRTTACWWLTKKRKRSRNEFRIQNAECRHFSACSDGVKGATAFTPLLRTRVGLHSEFIILHCCVHCAFCTVHCALLESPCDPPPEGHRHHHHVLRAAGGGGDLAERQLDPDYGAPRCAADPWRHPVRPDHRRHHRLHRLPGDGNP